MSEQFGEFANITYSYYLLSIVLLLYYYYFMHLVSPVSLKLLITKYESIIILLLGS